MRCVCPPGTRGSRRPSASIIRRKRCKMARRAMSGLVDRSPAHRVSAVSYTHLDVYKRQGVYSSRKIEELCRENLVFRWLLEDQKTPDHCTIARFRGNRNLQEADVYKRQVQKHWYTCHPCMSVAALYYKSTFS